MEKKEAVKILAKKLAENGLVKLVVEESLKRNILETLNWAAVETKVRGFSSTPIASRFYIEEYCNDHCNDHLKDELRSRGANYGFISPAASDAQGFNIFITPLAVIGEEEADCLKKEFYKNVPDDIKEAFNVLSIKSYIEIYQQYIQGNLSGCVNQRLDELLKRTPALSLVGKKVVYIGGHEAGISKGETGVFTEKENDNTRVPILWDNFNPDRHDQYGPKGHCWWVDKSTLLVEISAVDKEFAEFVFCLPLEEQNLKANKIFIKERLVDSTKIAQEQYIKNPEIFKEYFPLLDEKQKLEVIKEIKTKKQNEQLNLWLFTQGCVEGNYVHFLNLYLNNPKGFKEHFLFEQSKEGRGVMINTILGLPQDIANRELDSWISSQEPGLVDKVGRDRYILGEQG